MNTCCFTGNIVNDLKLSYTKGREERKPVPVLNFILAVHDKTQPNTDAVFLRFMAFHENAAAIAEHFCKGSRILLTAKAVNNCYTDKNGILRNETVFQVVSFDVLDTEAEFEEKRRKVMEAKNI